MVTVVIVTVVIIAAVTAVVTNMIAVIDITLTKEATSAVLFVGVAVRNYACVSFGVVSIVEVCRKEGLVVMMMVSGIVDLGCTTVDMVVIIMFVVMLIGIVACIVDVMLKFDIMIGRDELRRHVVVRYIFGCVSLVRSMRWFMVYNVARVTVATAVAQLEGFRIDCDQCEW